MGHTPGPWWIEEPDDPAEDERQISDGFGHTATVYGDAETATANARLIAAAPELLKTLRFILPVLENAARRGTIDSDGVNLELEAAREVASAIAQAEGRSE